MASVRIIRLKESSIKESVLSLELTVPVTNVITDLDVEINSLQHFRTLISALTSDLPRILFLVTTESCQDIYKSDIQEVKMVKDKDKEKGLIPTLVLRKDFNTSEGVINYEGIALTFELKGRKLVFGIMEDGSEG